MISMMWRKCEAHTLCCTVNANCFRQNQKNISIVWVEKKVFSHAAQLSKPLNKLTPWNLTTDSYYSIQSKFYDLNRSFVRFHFKFFFLHWLSNWPTEMYSFVLVKYIIEMRSNKITWMFLDSVIWRSRNFFFCKNCVFCTKSGRIIFT